MSDRERDPDKQCHAETGWHEDGEWILCERTAGHDGDHEHWSVVGHLDWEPGTRPADEERTCPNCQAMTSFGANHACPSGPLTPIAKALLAAGKVTIARRNVGANLSPTTHSLNAADALLGEAERLLADALGSLSLSATQPEGSRGAA